MFLVYGHTQPESWVVKKLQANGKWKRNEAILMSNIKDFKSKSLHSNKSVSSRGILTIINMYIPSVGAHKYVNNNTY